ncbi:MAG: transglutaminase domain-containing protein [Vulcanimicrobiota bacterium]
MKIRSLLLALGFGLALAAAQPAAFDRVDQRALAAPVQKERSLDELAHYLCPSAYSDDEKARSIFRWVADRIVYDLDGLRSDRLGSQQPEEVLQARKAVCEGYARLYQALAEKGGLKSEFISGRSAYNDQLPFKLPNGMSGHGWNAVYLRGRWRLLDVTWAAGSVDSQARFRKGFDEFWYLTPPEQFVYTHLPKDSHWQMLASPWSSQRFEATPQYTSLFFRYGLTPPEGLSEPARLDSDGVLTFRAPEDVVGISELRDSRGQKLENWTLSQSPRGSLDIRVRCPRPGQYRLVVFGRRRGAAWEGNVESPQTYNGLVEIEVQARQASARPFPKVFGSFQRGGAELVSPLDGQLRAGSRQRFRLRAGGSRSGLFWGPGLSWQTGLSRRLL